MPGPARTVTVTGFGDFRDLQAELERTGIIADTSTKKIVTSASGAGRAAADQAKAMGASADEQTVAAGRAAAAYVDSSSEISKAQKAAASAAAEAARVMGASADEQVAASRRAMEAAAVAGKGIGTAFEDGTSRAGNALERLGATGASWGIPFSGSLTKMGKQFDEAETKGQKMTSVLSSLGKLTLGVGAVGGIAAGVESVKGASDLQKQMEMIHTQAGASQAEVQKMTKAVIAMGPSVGTGPEKLAESLYHVESVGLRGAKALEVLKMAAQGAQVGGANLVDVQNALDAAVVSGIKGTQNYSQAMGAMNAIVGSGDMKMQDLADAFGTGLLANVKAAGVSFKNVGAALAVFGDNNLRGSEAATKLSSAIRIMAAPSKASAEALATIGIKSTQLGHDMQHGGLVPAIEDLKTHLKDSGATAEQTELILTRAFGGRQSTGVKILIEQLERLKEKERDIGKGQGSFGSDWEARTKTLSYQMDQLKAEIQSLGDKFGMFLIPKLEEAGHALSDMINWMEKHKAVAEALGLTISGVLGLAVAVFAEQKAVQFGRGVASMVSDMGKLVTALGSGTEQMVGFFTGQSGASTAAAAKIEADSAATASAVQTEATRIQGANAEVDASFAELGPAAASGTASVDTAVSGEAAAVGTADSAIEAENVAAGASFTAMLGPIAAVVAAVAAAEPVINKLTGGGLSETAAEGQRAGSQLTHSRAGSVTGQALTQLEQSGLSPIAASGAAGNFAQESSDNPSMDTKEGRGLASWTGSREAALEAYAKGMGVSPNNEGTQIEFLVKELRSRGELGKLNAAKTPQEAADIFEKYFERADPAKANLPHREKAAEEAYNSTTHTGHNKAGGAVEEGVVHAKYKTPQNKEAAQAQKAIKQAEEAAGKGLSPAALKALEGESTAEKNAKYKKEAAALGVPAGIVTMLSTAKALVGTKYTSGGGHDGWDPIAALKKIGVDCSGFVSQVLHTGGVLSNPLTTSGLPGAKGITPGGGKYVTVYDRPSGSQAHELIDILGHYFESGGNPKANPSGGVSLLTAAQAKTELAGGGFEAFHPTALNAAVHGGADVTALKNGLAPQEAVAKSLEELVKKLETSGTTELKKLQSGEQTGTPSSLEKALGVSTAGKTGQKLSRLFSGAQGSELSQRELEQSVMPTLKQGAQGSATNDAFNTLVKELNATHSAALKGLAGELVQAHKQALANLGRELYAVTEEKQAQAMQNEATQDKDRTTQAADLASKQLQVVKDQSTQQTDAMSAAAKQIEDAATQIKDEFAAAAEAIQNASQTMADSASGEVQHTQDLTATRVAELGERGKYGLELIAQKQEVQLDQMKSAYDIQIQQAKMALDQAKTATQQLVAEKQQNVDLLQAHEDAVVAMSQAHADAVQVSGDQQIATAQAALDAVQLGTDIRLDSAEQTQILVANGTKAQQDAAKGWVTWASAAQATQVAESESRVKAAESSANSVEQSAAGQLALAQGQANQAMAEAQRGLAEAEGQAKTTLARAEQSLTSIEDTAKVAESGLEGQVAITRAEAQTQYSGSGLVIQEMNINGTNASATEIASEMSWELRGKLPLPV